MQLIVKNMSGNTITLDVEDSDTIGLVKQQIKERVAARVAVSRIVLICGVEVLADGAKVSELPDPELVVSVLPLTSHKILAWSELSDAERADVCEAPDEGENPTAVVLESCGLFAGTWIIPDDVDTGCNMTCPGCGRDVFISIQCSGLCKVIDVFHNNPWA